MSRTNGKAKAEPFGPFLSRTERLDDSAGQEKHPGLYWLLEPAFKDGKCVRLGGSIRIKVVGAFYVVSVNCPTEKVAATVLLPTLANLLDQLEEALKSPATVWLPDYDSQKKARQQAKG